MILSLRKEGWIHEGGRKEDSLANVKCDDSTEKALGKTPKNSLIYQDPNEKGNIQLVYVSLEPLVQLAK